MPGWLSIVFGVLLLLAAFREIFLDLFHPSNTGVFSLWVGKTLFKIGRFSPIALTTVGPLTIVLVIFSWACMVAVGFALLYQPFLQTSFDLKDGVPQGTTFVTALYFSLECLTTLGLGELIPKSGWLRIAGGTEALLGISLVTASITWITLLYPALSRLRALARLAFILQRSQEETGTAIGENLVTDLAEKLTMARVDFIHFPIIYYFRAGMDEASLPTALPLILNFARQGTNNLASAALRHAVEELLALLRQQFLPGSAQEPEQVFKSYSDSHMVDLP